MCKQILFMCQSNNWYRFCKAVTAVQLCVLSVCLPDLTLSDSSSCSLPNPFPLHRAAVVSQQPVVYVHHHVCILVVSI